MRKQAYRIVYETMEKNGHSNEVFHQIILGEKNLAARDKSFLKRLGYGTIERAVELDGYLDQVSRIPVRKMDGEVRTVLRMAMYEILYMEQVPEAVSCHEAAELIRWAGKEGQVSFVNGVLRGYLRRQEQLDPGPKWRSLSLPKPLWDHFSQNYGKKTAGKIGSWFLENKGEITLHLDPQKAEKEQWIKQLEDLSLIVLPGRYMKDAVRVKGIRDLSLLPGYREGIFFVQDESSMLPVTCSGIKPGDCVVDICSAPGGKAMHAWIQMEKKGCLSARDVKEGKVAKIRENMKRMGYDAVQTKVWDATREDKEFCLKADVILADVPCSGLGIIGKKPEIKYRGLQLAEELVPLQRKICEKSLTMLKPGGVFMYSTCTINPSENQENVAWLAEHFDLETESLNPYLPEKLQNKMTGQGMLQMLPGVMESDGFFVARLRKRG